MLRAIAVIFLVLLLGSAARAQWDSGIGTPTDLGSPGFSGVGGPGFSGNTGPISPPPPPPTAFCTFTTSTCNNGANVPVSTEIAVSRSSSPAFALTSGGTFTSFASNTPRITNQGLLVEAAATNLITQSNNFTNAAWTQLNVSLSTPAIISPDGTNDTTLILDNTTNSQHDIFQTFGTATGGQIYTVSAYVKADTLTTGTIGLGNFGATNFFYVFFDVSTGTLQCSSAQGSCNSNSIQALGNTGWYHICGTGTLTATQTAYMGIQTTAFFGPYNTGINYAGIGQGFYIWGAQVETGSNCSSPIVTTSSTATRAADVVTTADKLQSVPNAATGTVTACVDQTPSLTTSTIWGASAAALLGTTSLDLASITLSGQETDSPAVGRWADPNCLGVAWSSAGRTLVLDGMSAATDSVPMTPSTAGYLGSTGGTTNFCNCFIQSVAVYSNTALSAGQLAALTPQGKPHIPAQAVALNFTNAGFFDEFNTINTIDVNNTLAPGFHWYTKNQWVNMNTTYQPGYAQAATCPPTGPGNYAVTNGILLFNNIGNAGCPVSGGGLGFGLNTAASTPTGNGYVGQGFAGGFCAQYRFAASVADSTGGENFVGWPIIWETPIEPLLGTANHFTEWDMMEWFPGSGGPGTVEPDASTVHDWWVPSQGGAATNGDSINNSFVPNPTTSSTPSYNLSTFHYAISCWTPQAKSPTAFGTMFTMIDGQLQGTFTINYTATGQSIPVSTIPFNGEFSTIDALTPMISLWAGAGNPFYVDDVQIWQGVGRTPPASVIGFDPSYVGPDITLSAGNRVATVSNDPASAYDLARSVTTHTTGRYYFECQFANGALPATYGIGIGNASAVKNGIGPADPNAAGVYGDHTKWPIAGGGTSTPAIGWVSGDTVGIAVDTVQKLAWQIVMHNGTVSNWNGSATANPATGTGGVSPAGLTDPITPCAGATPTTPRRQ